MEGYQPGTVPRRSQATPAFPQGPPGVPTPVQPAREARTARAGQRGPGPAVTGGYGRLPGARAQGPPRRHRGQSPPNPSGAIAALTRLSRSHTAALSFSLQWLPSPAAACAEGLTKAPKLQGKRGAAPVARPPLEVVLHYSPALTAPELLPPQRCPWSSGRAAAQGHSSPLNLLLGALPGITHI